MLLKRYELPFNYAVSYYHKHFLNPLFIDTFHALFMRYRSLKEGSFFLLIPPDFPEHRLEREDYDACLFLPDYFPVQTYPTLAGRVQQVSREDTQFEEQLVSEWMTHHPYACILAIDKSTGGIDLDEHEITQEIVIGLYDAEMYLLVTQEKFREYGLQAVLTACEQARTYLSILIFTLLPPSLHRLINPSPTVSLALGDIRYFVNETKRLLISGAFDGEANIYWEVGAGAKPKDDSEVGCIESFLPLSATRGYLVLSNGGSNGFGQIIDLEYPSGRAHVFHQFNATDGMFPSGTLHIGPGRSLFGVTAWGGAHEGGTVYRLSPEPPRFLFGGGIGQPKQFRDGLVNAEDGYFYGVSFLGGTYNLGTLFRVSKDLNTLEVVHSFQEQEGKYPFLVPTRGTGGWLYGVTRKGGQWNCGTVYGYNVRTGEFVVLYVFKPSIATMKRSRSIVNASGFFTWSLWEPCSQTVWSQNGLYVMRQTGGYKKRLLRLRPPQWQVETVAEMSQQEHNSFGLASDQAGYLYWTDGIRMYRFDPSTEARLVIGSIEPMLGEETLHRLGGASEWRIRGFTLDGRGKIYSWSQNHIYLFDENGDVSLLFDTNRDSRPC